MMRRVVGASLRFRFIVVAAAVATMVVGVVQLRDVPVDVFPEFAPPLVEIQTEGFGMSTSEVEAMITVPLEQSLNSTPGLDVIRSKTVPGVSSVKLIFKQGTDIQRARQLVQERLAIAVKSLPSSAGLPWILQPLSATSRVMKIGLSSTRYSLTDLSMIAYWTMRWRLMKVPGVANVVIWGDRFKQLQVQVDPSRMASYGVTLDQVDELTSEALDFGLLKYAPGSKGQVGGFIDTANQRLGVEHLEPVVGPSDLSRLAVYGKRKADGSALTIGDLADVTWGNQPLFGDAVVNDHPGLLLVVEKFPWGNTLDVTRGVDKALAEMRPGLPGVEIDSNIFRPATFIELALHNLTRALVIACLLVIVVLGAFLFEWRTVLISLIAIPLSLLAAGLMLDARGATVNTMILAGLVIAVGAVVDDAIIDVENIMRRLRQHRAEGGTRPTARVVLDASLEVRSAIVYATLIIVLAVLPVFFLGGVSGSFFRPLAVSYALALLASMIVALTLTPALCLLLLARAPLERPEPPLQRFVKRVYTGALARIIRRPGPAFLASAATVVAGVVAFPFLGQALFPEFRERDFLTHWVTNPGTSHDEVVRITSRVSRDMRAIPGVQGFGSHIGRAVAGEEIAGVNFAENWISVDPNADYDGTVAAIEKTALAYPGLFHSVETYLNERIDEVLVGSSDDVVVRIFGSDLDVLRKKATEVTHSLATIPGTADVHSELQTDVPHVQVSVDLAKAQRYGLKPGDVRRAAATLVAGTEVSDIHRDSKVWDIIVWSTPSTRDSVSAVENLLIDAPVGGHVRLKDVASVEVLPTPNQIVREDSSRRIDVSLNADGRDLGEVVADVQKRLGAIAFPLGYHAEVLGEYRERQAAQRELLGFGALAAIGIFLLLQASFGSFRLAALTFFTLPMALVGGVLAAYLAGGVLSIGSLVGFLTVFGIAARNGIMLINHYQHLERVEGMEFGPELVLHGARERLTPILMTALAMGLALLPLVVAGSVPGDEIEHPMAVVILGGLVTSTVLNLFVVPSLYLRSRGARPAAPA
jgi:CzcA family heavy metal efflux pump